MTLGLVYVLPVHNEEQILADSVRTLAAYLEKEGGGHILMVENGSRDQSWPLSQELEKTVVREAVTIRAFREENKGIGYAYQRGMQEAVALLGPTEKHWVVLTAGDLPFGFTDAEAARPFLDSPRHRILIGSKAHPKSHVPREIKRRVFGIAYRWARRVAVGMRVKDSQGSPFVRLDLAAELLPKIHARDFFYSTELCWLAERQGETVEELPIVLQPERRGSTVKPVQDGLKMARQLLALRRR